MPMMKGWKSTRKVPPPPITTLTIAFFVLNWDSRTGNIEWSGIGKYINEAFRYIAIVCAVVYLFSYYRKKWTQLMRPILYVLGFGILFGLTAAICFPLGFDITGNTNASYNDVSSTGEFSSVYSFAFVRSFFCLVLWVFHFFNYVDKFNEREEEAEAEAEAEERDTLRNTLSVINIH